MKVSAFSLGIWRTFGEGVEDAAAERILAEAYDSGVNFFDAAESYGKGKAEEQVGRILKKLKWKRESYAITSKLSPREVPEYFGVPMMYGLSRKRISEAVDASLKRLGLDHIDIFFCHRPYEDTALEDIVITMNSLIQQGKIFYWGTSEFSPGQLLKLWEIAKEYKMSPPLVEQTGHNLIGRYRMERDLLPVFETTRMATMTYCPLRSGKLTGKYLDGQPKDSLRAGQGVAMDEEERGMIVKLKDLADELGISLIHLSLAWILKNPNVSNVILGASRPGQIHENVKAVDALPKLTDDVMDRIEKMLDNHPMKARG